MNIMWRAGPIIAPPVDTSPSRSLGMNSRGEHVIADNRHPDFESFFHIDLGYQGARLHILKVYKVARTDHSRVGRTHRPQPGFSLNRSGLGDDSTVVPAIKIEELTGVICD